MKSELHEQDLDDILAEAKAQKAPDCGPLLARVLDDAAKCQPQQAGSKRPIGKPATTGIWVSLANCLGGKSVLAGLGAAAVAGLMLGFAQPQSVAAVANILFTESQLDDVDLLPGIDAILNEG